MEALINWLVTTFPPLSEGLARFIVYVLYSAVLAFVAPVIIVVAYTYMERKVLARIQDRIGPNRAGPLGVFQGFADAIKMLTKEDVTPASADRIVFNLAPILATIAAILVFAVLPVAPGVIGADLQAGILYVVAIGALGEVAALMAGWSSNNKFALLGAFRAVAQLIAYEIPIVLAILAVVLATGSMQVSAIVAAQDIPFVVVLPVAFLIFLIASIAEIGRCPFDLLEAESEIVAGFHVEYSGMKFAFFFIGEYMHLFASAGIATTLFLGGWRGPFAGPDSLLGVLLGFVYFVIKTTAIIWVMMWVRGTLFRIRIDHLLDFAWKFLVPLGLILVVTVAIALKLPVISTPVLRWVALLVANVMTALLMVMAVVALARRSRSAALREVVGIEY
ncbi:MAG: NADH-quinone oxidoreductase subunit NuoH [Anaerolineae bacterium]